MRIVHESGNAALVGHGVGRRRQRPLTLDRVERRADRRHNLPVPMTSFIGRADALAAVGRHLGTTRLLTLTGAGGIGKTRLALQLAGTLVDTYADGVWLVELAALNEPALVPRAVATALAIQTPPARAAQDALLHALESSELLLILDNCEHLVDAAAQLAARLLRACPGLKVLATSREPLGIAGETVWRVLGLGVPAPARSGPGEPCPASAPLAEAGQLFAERARAARPGLVLDSPALTAVAEICRRLDGMPLAIELAAARVGALGVGQIAARLDDRFRLLAGGNRAALARHQTLRALVDWSYDLLTPDEQTMLRRLAVFTGGWTLDAAEAVCDGGTRDEGGVRLPHPSITPTMGPLIPTALTPRPSICSPG